MFFVADQNGIIGDTEKHKLYDKPESKKCIR